MTAQKKAAKPTPKPKATKVAGARLRSDKPLTEHEQIIARLDAILAEVYIISGLQDDSARRLFQNAEKMIWDNYESTKSIAKNLPEAIRGAFYR